MAESICCGWIGRLLPSPVWPPVFCTRRGTVLVSAVSSFACVKAVEWIEIHDAAQHHPPRGLRQDQENRVAGISSEFLLATTAQGKALVLPQYTIDPGARHKTQRTVPSG
jgi:hypothetical protein